MQEDWCKHQVRPWEEAGARRAGGRRSLLAWTLSAALALAAVCAVAVLLSTQGQPQGLAGKKASFTAAHAMHQHSIAKALHQALQMNDTGVDADADTDTDGGGVAPHGGKKEGWGGWFWHEEKAMEHFFDFHANSTGNEPASWDEGWDLGNLGNETAAWGDW